MTAPLMPEQDEVMEKAKQLRAAGVPLAEIEKYVASKRGPAVPRESLRLEIPKESTKAPAESTRGLSRSRPGASGDFQALMAPGQGKVLRDDVLPSIAAHALNAAQGIPGVEAVEAAAGSMGSKFTDRPMNYKESLETLRGETEKIPSELRMVEKVAGAAPLAGLKAFQAMSGAKAGTAYGAADQALNADPDMGMGERALRTAGGAAVGAGIGKVAEMGVTGARALGSKTSAANLFSKEAERAASAKRLYDAANAEGQGQAASQAIKDYLAEPEIAELAGKLRELDEFKTIAPDGPEMLDAIYKTLSDNAKTVGKALEVANPSKLNTGRFRQRDIKATQQRQLGAMDETMPSYREAVSDYAKRTAEMKAVARGQDALRERMGSTITPGKNLTRSTPEAFRNELDRMARTNPEQVEAAMQGILGGTREAFDKMGVRKGVKSLSRASSIMRGAPSPEQALFDLITRLSLTTAGAAK